MLPFLTCNTSSSLQAGTSEDADDGPPTPLATPRRTPMAVLRRSASSLKEKMVEFKVAFGTGTRPASDTSISRSHTGHNNAMSSRMRKAKEVAASIRRKLMPTRSNRGKPPVFPQVCAYNFGQQQSDDICLLG